MHVCLPNVYADIQKTRTLLLLVLRFEAFALPIRLNEQRGAHADMYTPIAISSTGDTPAVGITIW